VCINNLLDLLLNSIFKHISYQAYCNATFLYQFLVIARTLTGAWRQIAVAAKVCTAAPNILGCQYGTSCHPSDA